MNEKLKTNEIVLDEDIYPRTNKSEKIIEEYRESMSIGVKFPPILVQRIKDENDEKIIVLDGLHRLLAHKEMDIEEVDVKHWKNKLLDKRENLTALRIASIKANLIHGIRLTAKEKKESCRRMVEDDCQTMITEQEFADIFAVERQTVNNWISDIRARQKGSRDNLIYRLSFLGWTQQEIADKVGLTQTAITKIMKNANFGGIHNSVNSGKSISETTEFYGLDIPVMWAIVLREMDDLDRFEEFTKEIVKGEESYRPRVFNVWNFQGLDTRLGIKHKMNIPGQIALHYLYYFTKQGDLVLDPMAGGGSTIDACLIMGRKCEAYDKNPIEGRNDIEKHDILDGFKKKYDHIFLDPPYGDIGTFDDNSKFYDFIREIAKISYETVKDNGTVALVMCDRTKGEYDPFISECYIIFKDAGFRCIHRISCPLSTQSAHGDEVNKAKANKKLLGRDRVLYIFKKGESDDK